MASQVQMAMGKKPKFGYSNAVQVGANCSLAGNLAESRQRRHRRAYDKLTAHPWLTGKLNIYSGKSLERCDNYL